jgi:hypothetical protein
MNRDLTPDGQIIYEIIEDFDTRYRKKFKTNGDDGGNKLPPDSKVRRELDWTKMELVRRL